MNDDDEILDYFSPVEEYLEKMKASLENARRALRTGEDSLLNAQCALQIAKNKAIQQQGFSRQHRIDDGDEQLAEFLRSMNITNDNDDDEDYYNTTTTTTTAAANNNNEDDDEVLLAAASMTISTTMTVINDDDESNNTTTNKTQQQQKTISKGKEKNKNKDPNACDRIGEKIHRKKRCDDALKYYQEILSTGSMNDALKPNVSGPDSSSMLATKFRPGNAFVPPLMVDDAFFLDRDPESSVAAVTLCLIRKEMK